MHILIGLIVAFLLVLLLTNRKTRNCRWRANRRADTDGRAAWHCVTCGAQSFTTDGKAPQTCHAETPPPTL
ncbi:hypothetical protein E7681_00320 [Thalassobius vesicularis]|uniref:Uncharacterized protein n=1 Tax=Thalassobius vesicularis TaxID=1294297 RepID=A0A4S3MBZ4_9RHOB|nr:hypothetical protein [Thalassobius vesicularis]THD76321.1 hypothetical protein E7681_00320 [Thalassobius vesicularis]